jgi:hypothetical protein
VLSIRGLCATTIPCLQIVTQFHAVEALLDDSVGKTITVEVERGGQSISSQLTVQDLHSITPNWFLELSGGVVHPLSYQQVSSIIEFGRSGYLDSRQRGECPNVWAPV